MCEHDHNEIKLCDYGCGREATHYLKNAKKWCCSKSYNSCPEAKKKSKIKIIEITNEEDLLCDYGCGRVAKYKFKNGKICCNKNANACKKDRYVPIEIETNELCDYGCGQKAKYKFKNGKICCSDDINKCQTSKNKLSKSRKNYTGKNHPLYGKPCSESRKKKISNSNKEYNKTHKPIWLGRKHTEESKIKIGKKSLGRKHTEEFKENQRQKMLNGQSEYMNSIPRNEEKMKIIKEKRRIWMLENGRYVKSFIKKISKYEMKLRDMVKELFPSSEFQFSILNYDVDVAILEYKIAIEFDGYYHFDTEEHIEYHIMRQERIESEGWKFYRVSMYDKFPKLKEVKENIDKLILEIKNETGN